MILNAAFSSSTVGQLLAWLTLTIDYAIYNIMELIYSLFYSISTMSLFSTKLITSFINRIWLFIGIVVLFKLGTTLINYMINPDDFSNEKAGFGNVVSRVLVALVLLAFCQTGFRLLYQFQYKVINSGIIHQIILGRENVSVTNNADQGKILARGVFEGSFDYSGYTGSISKDDIKSEIEKCEFWKLHDLLSDENVNYYIGLDVILGAVVTYALFLFCLDVTARSIKLSIYEVIAPVPILMYIDPKKGDDNLKKWLTGIGTTYADLFVRISAIDFIVFVSSLLVNGGNILCSINEDGTTGDCGLFSSSSGFFAKAFIILGLFMFAKDFPKLLKDLFGIDIGSDGFDLSPKSRIKAAAYSVPIMGAKWKAEDTAKTKAQEDIAKDRYKQEIKDGASKKTEKAQYPNRVKDINVARTEAEAENNRRNYAAGVRNGMINPTTGEGVNRVQNVGDAMRQAQVENAQRDFMQGALNGKIDTETGAGVNRVDDRDKAYYEADVQNGMIDGATGLGANRERNINTAQEQAIIQNGKIDQKSQYEKDAATAKTEYGRQLNQASSGNTSPQQSRDLETAKQNYEYKQQQSSKYNSDNNL